jgi:hypothetical protein
MVVVVEDQHACLLPSQAIASCLFGTQLLRARSVDKRWNSIIANIVRTVIISPRVWALEGGKSEMLARTFPGIQSVQVGSMRVACACTHACQAVCCMTRMVRGPCSGRHMACVGGSHGFLPRYPLPPLCLQLVMDANRNPRCFDPSVIQDALVPLFECKQLSNLHLTWRTWCVTTV